MCTLAHGLGRKAPSLRKHCSRRGQRPPLIRTGQGAEKRVNQQDQALSNQGTPLMTHFLHLEVPPPPQTSSPFGVYMFQHRSLGGGILQSNCTNMRWKETGGSRERGGGDCLPELLHGGAEGANEKAPAFLELLLRSRIRH